MIGLISEKRNEFHRKLLLNNVLSFSPADSKVKKYGADEIASNADAGQKTSVIISNKLLNNIANNLDVKPNHMQKKIDGQTLGSEFEGLCRDFVSDTFKELSSVRPGTWIIEKISSRKENIIGRYEQYSHLAKLNELSSKYNELRNFLGDGYTIAPDIIVARVPENDEVINAQKIIVDCDTSKESMLRRCNHDDTSNPRQILHASISCKFTMRSDRSQNTRTEALNLIRSRKGRVPHIVSVTAETMPSRIASLALGTGDLDCVYHFALYELISVLEEEGKDDLLEFITSMVDGKRLKDISDLPLDLAI
ncbi:NgoMIV family type II restriction endonuclease [Aeromonas caviae]|uniref:NgoMIV family type II restriction endonuclease n=1 Tax=Aeromonas caviae TaxID=648 RepID=UPI002B466BE8|nr:NgoMIV family type II restriction endonuclease [Aeromonas caviae]